MKIPNFSTSSKQGHISQPINIQINLRASNINLIYGNLFHKSSAICVQRVNFPWFIFHSFGRHCILPCSVCVRLKNEFFIFIGFSGKLNHSNKIMTHTICLVSKFLSPNTILCSLSFQCKQFMQSANTRTHF